MAEKRSVEEVVLELLRKGKLKKGIPLERLFPEAFSGLSRDEKEFLGIGREEKPKRGRPRKPGGERAVRVPREMNRIATIRALEKLIEVKEVPLAERARVAEEKLAAAGFEGWEGLLRAKRIKRPTKIPPIVELKIAKEWVRRKDDWVMETGEEGLEEGIIGEGPRIASEGDQRASWEDLPTPVRKLENVPHGWKLRNRIDDVVTVTMETTDLDKAARRLGVTRAELSNAQRDPVYQEKFHARFRELNVMRDLYIVQGAGLMVEHLRGVVMDDEADPALRAHIALKWVEMARATGKKEEDEMKDRERLKELKASLEAKGRVGEINGETNE